ncbi:MAG: D-aminoacylase, partial [Zetaproteobacteria bacterium]
MYDMLFRQATVVDGSGAPAAVADVAVAGGRFVAVAPRLDGEAPRVVEARGLALTPGFID